MARQQKITAKAYRDLDERCDHNAQYDAMAAARLKAKVFKTCQFLLDFPESGSLCEYEDVPIQGLRFIAVKRH